MAAKCEKASKEELKGFVTKERFNEVNEEKKQAEADLKVANEKIDGFEKLNLDSETLKSEIETLKADNLAKDEAHKKEIHRIKVETAIDKAIADKKGKNSTAIKALLNSDNFNLDEVDFNDDGTVKGLAARLDELIKTDEYLFDTSEQKLTFKGTNPGESGNEPLDKGANTADWSYEDFVNEVENQK